MASRSIIVDVMPTEEEVLGFSNPWYKAGLAHLVEVTITRDCKWKIMSAPFALASKFTAFWERGKDDPQASHDLEDIVSLLCGRLEIGLEVQNAPADCRSYLADCCKRILSNERLEDALESHIFTDNFAGEKLKRVKEAMRTTFSFACTQSAESPTAPLFSACEQKTGRGIPEPTSYSK